MQRAEHWGWWCAGVGALLYVRTHSCIRKNIGVGGGLGLALCSMYEHITCIGKNIGVGGGLVSHEQLPRRSCCLSGFAANVAGSVGNEDYLPAQLFRDYYRYIKELTAGRWPIFHVCTKEITERKSHISKT